MTRDNIPEFELDRRPKADAPTLSDRLVGIVTVWGLGAGTAVALSVLGSALYHLHVGPFLIGCILGGAVGLTGGVGLAYMRYVQDHLNVKVIAPGLPGYIIAGLIGYATVFVVAFLFTALALLLLVGYVAYGEAQRRRQMTFRQKTDQFIGGIVPHIAFR